MTENDRPMAGKVCMVTGATSGIGKETTRALARMGATVVGVGRNHLKNVASSDEIRRETSNLNVEYLLADLSSQEEIRTLAQEFKRKYNRLNLLVNNAGATYARRQETADGIERTFALNHLGYFLLTNLLLDRLRASAPARIVNVSSAVHRRATLDFDDLQNQRKYNGHQAYRDSKLANILFTYELARRLEGTGVTVNAVSPGLVCTNLGIDNPGLMPYAKRFANRCWGISAEEGAQHVIYAATAPELEGVTGKYFEHDEAVASSDITYDEEAARRLRAISEEMTGVKG